VHLALQRDVVAATPSTQLPTQAPKKKKSAAKPAAKKESVAKKKATNYRLDKTGRPNWAVGQLWGNAADPAEYIECELGTPNNPGPAVDGAKAWRAELVPEKCLGYPDYKEGRGRGFFKKSGTKAAQLFYEANGYYKIAVKGSRSVFKYFKEIPKRA
jgi:hypothetical protein